MKPFKNEEERKKLYKQEYGGLQFNPKVEDFVKIRQDIKMIGFAWALHWRLMVFISIMYIGIFLIFLLLGYIIG